MCRQAPSIVVVLLLTQVVACAFAAASRRGDELSALGDYEGAVAAYEEAAGHDPEDASIVARLRQARMDAADSAVAQGFDHLEGGRLEASYARLERAEAHVPRHSKANKLRSDLQRQIVASVSGPAQGTDSDSRLQTRWRQAAHWCHEEISEEICTILKETRGIALDRAAKAVEAREFDNGRSWYTLLGQIEPDQQSLARQRLDAVDQAQARRFAEQASGQRSNGRSGLALVLAAQAAALSEDQDHLRLRDRLYREASDAAALGVDLRVGGYGGNKEFAAALVSRIKTHRGIHLAPGTGQRLDVDLSAPQCSESSVTRTDPLQYVHHVDVVTNPAAQALQRDLERIELEIDRWSRRTRRAEEKATVLSGELFVARSDDDDKKRVHQARIRHELVAARSELSRMETKERQTAGVLEQGIRAAKEVERLEAELARVQRAVDQHRGAAQQLERATSRVQELTRRLERLRREDRPDPQVERRVEDLTRRVQAARRAQSQAAELRRRIAGIDEKIQALGRRCDRDPAQRVRLLADIRALKDKRRGLGQTLAEARRKADSLSELQRRLAQARRDLRRTQNASRIEEVERSLSAARQVQEQASRQHRAQQERRRRRRQVASQLRSARASCGDPGPLRREHSQARQEATQMRGEVRRLERIQAARWVRPAHVVGLRHRTRQAQALFVEFRNNHDTAVGEYRRLEHELSRTPSRVERPVYATHDVRISSWTYACRAQASVKMKLDGVTQADIAQASAHTEDESHRGFEPAGLAVDPKQYPMGDQALFGALERDLLGDVEAQIVLWVAERRRRIIEAADTAKAVDPEAAADGYIRAWLMSSGQRAPEGLSSLLRDRFGTGLHVLSSAGYGRRAASDGM